MCNRTVFLAALVIAAILGGCSTPSLNRLSSEETLTKDDGLVGQWQENDDGDIYLVLAGDKGSYRLLGIPEDKDEATLTFEFRLMKLGEHRFIELTPAEGARKELGDRFGTTVVPVYVFMKVLRDGDSLKVWQVDGDWLTDGLEKGDHKLGFAKGEGDTIVLTASTGELQEFFKKHAADDRAFEKPMLLKRVGSASK